MKKILFYTNQFFGQIGGEEKAGIEPILKEGAVGAANLFKGKIDGAKIMGTIICGDNYYAENMEEARQIIDKYIMKNSPDILIAGPAFNAGRFGLACSDICAFIEGKYSIPTVTGLYKENPAVEMYRDKIYIVEAGKSAASMRKVVPKMINISNKLLNNEEIGLPKEEGYIPKGIRTNIFKAKSGAERALDMLVAKLNSEPYESEIPIPKYEMIEAAKPVKSLEKSKLALVTSGGIVPKGNPDHLPAATAKFYKKYSISDLEKLEKGFFESVHAGYDPEYANNDPNRIVPLDIMRQMESKKRVGSIYNYLFTTTGNSTSVADATRMGEEIAEELINESVDGVILTST